jgi:hypothetical protein
MQINFFVVILGKPLGADQSAVGAINRLLQTLGTMHPYRHKLGGVILLIGIFIRFVTLPNRY